MSTITPGIDLSAPVLEPIPKRVVWAENAARRLAQQRAERLATLRARSKALLSSSELYGTMLAEHGYTKESVAIRREWFRTDRSEKVARRSVRPPDPALSVAAVAAHPDKLRIAVDKEVARRPPLTRLVHRPGGTAVSLYLCAAAVAQVIGRPGRKVKFERHGFANVKNPDAKLIWSELIAEVAATREHTRRRMNDGLRRLQELKLVGQVVDHRWSKWNLRRENGTKIYRSPAPGDRDLLKIPIDFWVNGWVNVLTPNEIAVYFMLRDACWLGRNGVGVVDWKRKGYYGVSNEVYNAANELVEFGLIRRGTSAHTRRAGRVSKEALAAHRSGSDPLSVEQFFLQDKGLKHPAVEVVLERLAASALPPRWDAFK